MKKKLDIIITGLPRSGTSFLCARVNEYPNMVVINEPAEVFKKVRQGGLQGLLEIYQYYRSEITDGKPVLNKIREGKFIEDTRLEDNRRPHVHAIEDAEFALGIKNTLVFTAMLPDIVREKRLPKVLASIRHPLDCIASWYNVDFPHLKNARPEFLLNYVSRPVGEKLKLVLQEEDLLVRSAMLWNFLAQLLLSARGKIHLVRYEDIVSKPGRALSDIESYVGYSSICKENIAPSKPVRRRNDLSELQCEIIAEVCDKLASQFSYRF